MTNDQIADFLADWEEAFLQQRVWLYHWLFLPEISVIAAGGLMRMYAQNVA